MAADDTSNGERGTPLADGGDPGTADAIGGATDLNELIKQWTIFIGGLFVVLGAVMFLRRFLVFEIIDESITEEGAVATYWNVRSVGFAVFIGAGFAWVSDVADQDLYKAIAAAVFAGIVLWALVETILMSTIIADNASLDWGGFVQYALGVAIAGAIGAVGGSWVVRNKRPDLTGRATVGTGQPAD